jgi:hypothetical protein
MTSKLLYPHLTVHLDLEPLFSDLVQRYTHPGTSANSRAIIRRAINKRNHAFDTWLVSHGYQCGVDYQRTESGYRFSKESLATAFLLGQA